MNAIAAKCAAVWIILLSALVIQPPPPAQAEDSHVKGTVASAPIEGPRVPIGKPSVLASGAAEDTLKACKTRIPELASVGQHLLAEQSCAREEATRKTIRSAPTF